MDEAPGFKSVTWKQWKFPFQLRVGATGLGVGFGCGVGIGFGSPLNLHGIPGLGQIVSSIGSGLGSLNTATGGFGTKVRMQVRGRGIKGLDLGAGCGIGLGYGFGIGLMLRPDVLEGMSRALQHQLGNMMKSLPPGLQQAALPGQRSALPGQHSMLPGQQAGLPHQQQPNPWSPSPALSGNSTPSPSLSHGSVTQSSDRANAWQGNNVSAEGARDEIGSNEGPLLKEVLRSMLEQQSQIRELQKENLELKKAVCKLDKKAPFCRLGS